MTTRAKKTSAVGAVLSDDATTNARPGATWYHDGWRFELPSKRTDRDRYNDSASMTLHLFQTRGGRWYFVYAPLAYAMRLGNPRTGWFALTHASLESSGEKYNALTDDAAQILALVLW